MKKNLEQYYEITPMIQQLNQCYLNNDDFFNSFKTVIYTYTPFVLCVIFFKFIPSIIMINTFKWNRRQLRHLLYYWPILITVKM